MGPPPTFGSSSSLHRRRKFGKDLTFLSCSRVLTPNEIAISVAHDIVGFGAKFLEHLANRTKSIGIVNCVSHDKKRGQAPCHLNIIPRTANLSVAIPSAQRGLPSPDARRVTPHGQNAPSFSNFFTMLSSTNSSALRRRFFSLVAPVSRMTLRIPSTLG